MAWSGDYSEVDIKSDIKNQQTCSDVANANVKSKNWLLNLLLIYFRTLTDVNMQRYLSPQVL